MELPRIRALSFAFQRRWNPFGPQYSPPLPKMLLTPTFAAQLELLTLSRVRMTVEALQQVMESCTSLLSLDWQTHASEMPSMVPLDQSTWGACLLRDEGVLTMDCF